MTLKINAMVSIGLLGFSVATAMPGETWDAIDFADVENTKQHHVRIHDGSLITGGRGQTGLQLRAPATDSWRGGTASFKLKTSPDAVNYFSIRLWGGEAVDGNLTLICDGKQVGDRLLSDFDQLDFGARAPQFPGAFFYRTSRLPDAVTRGKREIECTIEASGPIFSYGTTFMTFQRPMKTASRGVHGVFIHDDPWLVPPPSVNDGSLEKPRRQEGIGRIAPKAPGSEVLSEVKNRVEAAAEDLLTTSRALGQVEIWFLAELRHKTWSKYSRDSRVTPAIVKAMDEFIAAYARDPAIVRFEKSTWNPDWFGLGLLGRALALDPAAYVPYLDEPVAWQKDTRISRRAALTEMLIASRDWLRTHRRFYTNQSMIVDCFGIYLSNRGVAVLDPAQAMLEPSARRYLYEAVGLEEWRGDDLPGGRHTYDAGGPDGTKAEPYRVAPGHHLVTRAGLTRELGYVGTYGEVMNWVGFIYEATRPAPGQPGDPKIKGQLARIALARAPFRYPSAEADGFAAMRMMSDIGWRDLKSPGDVTYVELAHSGLGTPIRAAILTGDPRLIGHAQQMVEENALWPAIRSMTKATGFRATHGLLDVIDDVVALANLPAQAARLPMTEGQPDFAFVDPENGVIAIKRGEERFYASLYWRSNRGVSGRGRVWLSGPRGHRIATLDVKTGFTPSGSHWVRPDKVVLLKGDEINKGYGLSLAEAGESLPLVQPPPGLIVRAGQDSIYAGRGDHYLLEYGGYTIAINMSAEKKMEVDVPRHSGEEFISRKKFEAGKKLRLAPLSAAAFFSGD